MLRSLQSRREVGITGFCPAARRETARLWSHALLLGGGERRLTAGGPARRRTRGEWRAETTCFSAPADGGSGPRVRCHSLPPERITFIGLQGRRGGQPLFFQGAERGLSCQQDVRARVYAPPMNTRFAGDERRVNR